ncbi:MAG TPA: response regulator [Nitrososphaeraceae archaeon]|nr:response regulator [Nitrososphaeraceae archaeon]
MSHDFSSLPQTLPLTSLPSSSSSTTIEAKKGRILIVDDEPEITKSFGLCLEDIGLFDVETYNNSVEALSNFKSDSYNLVLLDIKMPRMNGFELYEKMKRIDSNVKVCFISAYDPYSDELKDQFLSLGVGCFIPKPVQIKDLIEKIETELLR